jgi:pyridoxal phosphate enzyme (YggS family)
MSEIEQNIARVEERITAACRRAGRRRKDVRMVAVSKTVPPERIRDAYEAGLRNFGENRVQEVEAKRTALRDLEITWHMIGHLQTNKARSARALFHWVQSLDSLRLAEKLNRAPQAAEPGSSPSAGTPLPVLIEVNLGGEVSKSGVAETGALDLARAISALPNLSLRGLMTVPPLTGDPEGARPYFARLRELASVIDSAPLPNVNMDELSMGMSYDFEVAIEEGATLVRIGSAIFGERPRL